MKVIHLSSNPFMQARQSKSEQMERLKQECEALRRRVKMLEEGEKTTSTHIERIVLDESSPHDVTGIHLRNGEGGGETRGGWTFPRRDYTWECDGGDDDDGDDDIENNDGIEGDDGGDDGGSDAWW